MIKPALAAALGAALLVLGAAGAVTGAQAQVRVPDATDPPRHCSIPDNLAARSGPRRRSTSPASGSSTSIARKTGSAPAPRTPTPETKKLLDEAAGG